MARSTSMVRAASARRKAAGRPPPFPTRIGSTWSYIPALAIACYCGMIIGVGIWVHYTDTTITSFEDMLVILNAQVDQSNSTPADEVASSGQLIITTCVSLIFGACCLALILWRAKIEADQDVEGEVGVALLWWLWLVYAAQVAWWCVMIWLILIIMGDGVLATSIFAINTQLQAVEKNQALCYAARDCPKIPQSITWYNCPGHCFTLTTTGFLESFTPQDPSTTCICDLGTVSAARYECSTAFQYVGGMFAGIWILLLCSMGLHHCLSQTMGKGQKEEEIDEILMG